jgi:CheY-like chemotaxis protein
MAMPRQNGYWLVREVRSLSPSRGGRVGALAITAYGTVFEREQAIWAGFDEYVVKPVERWELCRIVATLARYTALRHQKFA